MRLNRARASDQPLIWTTISKPNFVVKILGDTRTLITKQKLAAPKPSYKGKYIECRGSDGNRGIWLWIVANYCRHIPQSLYNLIAQILPWEAQVAGQTEQRCDGHLQARRQRRSVGLVRSMRACRLTLVQCRAANHDTLRFYIIPHAKYTLSTKNGIQHWNKTKIIRKRNDHATVWKFSLKTFLFVPVETGK